MSSEVWAAIERVSVFIGGLSTLAIAVLTVLLWRENRMLRKAGSNPLVAAHLEPHPDGTGGVNLALANIGTGPAFDVKFNILAEKNSFEEFGVIHNPDQERAAMTLLPAGSKFSFLFGIGHQLFKKGEDGKTRPLSPFKVEVSWRGLGSLNIESKCYVLDVSQFAGIHGILAIPYTLQIVEQLKAINKNMCALTEKIAPIARFVDSTSMEQVSRQKVKGDPLIESKE